MKGRRLRAVLGVLASLLFSVSAHAGEERPKIGLALAGGGAKGGAHVGVLRVLEELNVPIDYIAGTSIGSIVGGLYATGLSAAEIEETLATTDWDDLLRDKPARRDLAFRRKEDDARYLFDLELGLSKKGLEFPGGLLNGQKLFFMLQSLTLPVASIDDFDELPIPFRAVATDVRTGDMVVMGNGSLATAIRASMALPAIFSPVERQGQLLVDGGMVNNVPVDVVLDMGADVVIAVDLGAPLSSQEVENLVGVYQQTMRMLTRPNMTRRLEMADLVVEPPGIVDFKTMDFGRIAEIIPLGEQAAREHVETLERWAIGPDAFAEHRATQRPPESSARTMSFVRVEGNERVDRRVIEHRLRHRLGDPLDLDELFADLNRVYGLGDFELVDFAIDETGGEQGLVVRTQEKPWGPNYLHFGIGFQSDLDGETEFGLLANLTLSRLNRLGGEWRNDLLIGARRGLLSEFYQPFDFGGSWFVAPSLEFTSEQVGFFVDGRRAADLDVDVTSLSVDFGHQFTKYAEMRLGFETGRAEVDVATGELPGSGAPTPLLDEVEFGGVSFEFNSDRLDRVTVPRDGTVSQLRLFTSLNELGSEQEFDTVELSVLTFRSRFRQTVFGSIDAGWSSGDLPDWAVFRLGGFASLSGFAENELRGQYSGVARAGYYYNMRGNLYLGGWLELGNVWQTTDEIKLDNAIFAATAFLGLDLRFGPLYIAFGQAEEGENKVYVSLGRAL